ncbi:hypothetical protein [Flavobacterium sp. NRK1]|uniref:HYC_CC_PP family protein n=1 Tax=Flavobacterium sp. NRK1 TaxID=2954929 RepID=UPI0020929A84|nr:hypothetical protein [Flavobacterium sp. NRK1]MCO6148228.1 hypothetical protein [Flavobacterium sp. NRK1]
MKIYKHISILLTFLILASNMGFALNVHYCHNEVSSVSFAYRIDKPCNITDKKETKSCCAAAAESHKKCCKNNLVKLQDDDHNNIIVKSLQLNLSAFCAIEEWRPALFNTGTLVSTDSIPSFYCEAHAPPLFKLYCQYIFYA